MDSPPTTFRPALLGKRLATYRALPLPPSTWLIWLGIWAVLLAVPSAIDVQLRRQSIFLAALGSAVTVWTAVQRGRRRLDLYQDGFDLRVGKRHRRVCWNQIYEVYQVPLFRCLSGIDARTQPASWLLKIVRRDGRRLRLSGFESMDRLGSQIQHRLCSRQLMVALEAYRAGYTVRFGRHFAVGQDGIYVHHQRMNWTEITEISIDDMDEIRLIPLSESSPTIRISSSQVPNLTVLHEFLKSTQQEDEMAFTGESEANLDEPFCELGADGYAEPEALSRQEPDEAQLLLAGFDWEDLSELRSGAMTVEELVARGPRHRPRYPR